MRPVAFALLPLILLGCGPASAPSADGPKKSSFVPEESKPPPSAPVTKPPRKATRPKGAPPQPAAQEDVALKDRYINVSARCESAEQAYNQIKADSAAMGRSPHPDLSTQYFRMKSALDTAKREVERHEDQEARHSLDVAEVSAAKVLRAAGGH